MDVPEGPLLDLLLVLQTHDSFMDLVELVAASDNFSTGTLAAQNLASSHASDGTQEKSTKAGARHERPWFRSGSVLSASQHPACQPNHGSTDIQRDPGDCYGACFTVRVPFMLPWKMQW